MVPKGLRLIKLYCILVILLGVSISAHAQKGLIFQKPGKHGVTYETGEIITFNIKTHPYALTDQIMGFEDTLIVFRNYKISPREITYMWVDSKTKDWYFMKFKWSKLCFLVGGGYMLLNLINEGELTQEAAVFSGSLIAAGFITKAILKPRIKIKGGTRVHILR